MISHRFSLKNTISVLVLTEECDFVGIGFIRGTGYASLPTIVKVEICTNHMILEMWNPLGIVGVITYFNFPCVVLVVTSNIPMVHHGLSSKAEPHLTNEDPLLEKKTKSSSQHTVELDAPLSVTNGQERDDTKEIENEALTSVFVPSPRLVYKKNGAPTTPLVTIVMTKIVASVLGKNNLLGSIFTAFCGGAAGCQAITMDTRILLVLFTGSSKVGLAVQQTVSKRFGKCLLELSGNSAIIIMGDADIKLDVRSVFFAAVGKWR
ncbi:hypothetical protein H5410_056878 [Solanum commersonii]|uniref:aldehyde dehydrogenase (NAD(+)) n=1 Tax=Solanum commersonii TaxID=4109 RepID=A0A9J5WP04_SOLCO|nr:hypothetical protein H5410_056878 [Solanum commersonii]